MRQVAGSYLDAQPRLLFRSYREFELLLKVRASEIYTSQHECARSRVSSADPGIWAISCPSPFLFSNIHRS